MELEVFLPWGVAYGQQAPAACQTRNDSRTFGNEVGGGRMFQRGFSRVMLHEAKLNWQGRRFRVETCPICA